MLEEINAISNKIVTLLVVGHEPTTSLVALALTGASINDVAAQPYLKKTPNVNDHGTRRSRLLATL